MKKILFATTALVLSAGVAAADVTVGGNGRAGVVYNGDDWNFSSRIRAVFTLSGETDNGVAFGGTFRADNAGNAAAGAAGNVYMSGPWGKLALGDLDAGAAEAAIGDLHGVGYTAASGDFALNETQFVAALTATNDPVALYSYTAGDLGLYLSLKDHNDDESYAAGLTYKFGDFGVAAAYETNDDADQALIAGTAKFGDVAFKAFYAQGTDGDDYDFDQYGVSLAYKFDATTLTVFARELDNDETGKNTYIGAGAAYDLGGGMAVKAGVIDIDTAAGRSDTVADFGVTFNF